VPTITDLAPPVGVEQRRDEVGPRARVAGADYDEFVRRRRRHLVGGVEHRHDPAQSGVGRGLEEQLPGRRGVVEVDDGVGSLEHGAEAERVDEVADRGAYPERDQVRGGQPVADGRAHLDGSLREQRVDDGAPERAIRGGHDDGHPRSLHPNKRDAIAPGRAGCTHEHGARAALAGGLVAARRDG